MTQTPIEARIDLLISAERRLALYIAKFPQKNDLQYNILQYEIEEARKDLWLEVDKDK